MSTIIFNLEYVLNGWFETNFTKIGPRRYVYREGHLSNFSKIYCLTDDGDIETFILRKETK